MFELPAQERGVILIATHPCLGFECASHCWRYGNRELAICAAKDAHEAFTSDFWNCDLKKFAHLRVGMDVDGLGVKGFQNRSPSEYFASCPALLHIWP